MLAGLRHFGEEFLGGWSMFSGEVKRKMREKLEGYLYRAEAWRRG
jgi:hypothetical protein